METKEIKINCPEGFTIDKENSTFECIKFKPIKKELSKTWEEYCKTHPRRKGECWINIVSDIKNIDATEGSIRHCFGDRNILPSKELAEAMLALCQLIQLRECYNDGWKPDWNGSEYKYVIEVFKGQPYKTCCNYTSKILAFKTEELCNDFLNNFKDLIEIAKPLL